MALAWLGPRLLPSRDPQPVAVEAATRRPMFLDVRFVRHGTIIEAIGRTLPGSGVMINAEQVPLVRADGAFHFFTPPLPRGEYAFVITAQDPQGAVITQRHTVKVE